MRFLLIFCQIGDVAAKTEALAMMKAGEVLSELSSGNLNLMLVSMWVGKYKFWFNM